MPRKNNPKQTVENILSVSAKLFIEKGYDQTSMQNIVDALGMSKGAIFHHFGSKEEIFKAVMDRRFELSERKANKWLDEMAKHTPRLTARERIISLCELNLNDWEIHALDKVLAQVKSPHIIVANMLGEVNKNATILARLIREGIADGSIQTEFPDECAQVVFLLLNVWCDPIVFECDMRQVHRRLIFLQHILKTLGMDIITDRLITGHLKLMDSIYTETQQND